MDTPEWGAEAKSGGGCVVRAWPPALLPRRQPESLSCGGDNGAGEIITGAFDNIHDLNDLTKYESFFHSFALRLREHLFCAFGESTQGSCFSCIYSSQLPYHSPDIYLQEGQE